MIICFLCYVIAMKGILDCHSIIPITFSNRCCAFHLTERIYLIHTEYP